jgi:aminoglycoside 6'-N-acetyltransferase
MAEASQKGVVRLRTATMNDCQLLRHWDEQPHVIASDPNDDWQWEQALPLEYEWREQLIAEADGRPIGYVEIINPAMETSHYWGDVPENLRAIDIWIGEEKDLRKGYGTEMMRLALEKCFAPPEVEAVLIDPLISNTGALGFYESMGFVPEGPRWFGQDHCLVLRLTRDAWEEKHGN